ncbi:MAG: hypothetical protein COB98_05575 [Flavobacteriaceae bacterium]|nr:MAG: hypothetical protein COB98_05575 [Flavobacteriaceae bacterium]
MKLHLALVRNNQPLMVVFLFAFLFSSCTEVVDIDLQYEENRLVIEASLDWKKGTTGKDQRIYLSRTTPYFENSSARVINAQVTVINKNTGDEFTFTDLKNGLYIIDDFIPIIGDTYLLTVISENQVYTAEETMMSVPEFTRVEQSLEGGFVDDILEVTFYFDDPVDVPNYYLSYFHQEGALLPYLREYSDEFTDGNELFHFYEKDDEDDELGQTFKPGDVVDIRNYAISEGYYNYISLLLEQYYNGGSPYSAMPAKLRGNCVNKENPDNYAFGYFRATEFVQETFVFKE